MASSHQESGHSAHPTPANAAVPVRSLLHRETGDSKLNLTNLQPFPSCTVHAATKAPCCVQPKGKRAPLGRFGAFVFAHAGTDSFRSSWNKRRCWTWLGLEQGTLTHQQFNTELTWQQRACAARAPCSHPRRLCRCPPALHEHGPSRPCAEPPGQPQRP